MDRQVENAAGCQLQASFAPLLSALGRACRHPDKNEEGKRGECEMRMKEINAAYRKLEQVCASPHVLPSPALSLPYTAYLPHVCRRLCLSYMLLF